MALAAGILLALAAPAVGSSGAQGACVGRCAAAEEEQAVSLLQTGSRVAARHAPPGDWGFYPLLPADGGDADLQVLLERSPGALEKMLKVSTTDRDASGHGCIWCTPAYDTPKDRWEAGYTYQNRTDCGKHSIVDHPELASVPIMNFAAAAGTNGFCELNFMGLCGAAMWNKDFGLWAKNYYIPPEMRNETVKEKVWCKMNGFFEPEILALQNDFDGMQAKSDELCKTKYGKKYDLSSITMDQFMMALGTYTKRGYPTFAEAEFIAAALCAMGSLGCDIAMCNYNYCEKEKGTFGITTECDGWDPVKGRPASAV